MEVILSFRGDTFLLKQYRCIEKTLLGWVLNTYKLMVTGRVQGVNYRRFVVEMAKALDYVGFTLQISMMKLQLMVINATYEEDLEFFISKLYDGSMFSDVHDVM